MWLSLASAALLAGTFFWLTLQLWQYSRVVGNELSIHRREHLSRRLQTLVLGCAGVAVLAFALQGAFVLQALDPGAQAFETPRKPITLRFDSELQLAPERPAPAVTSGDDIALAASAR